MKSSGRSTPPASSVIGSVEVFEHSSASALMTGRISAKTLALSDGSSKTASMTRSQPASCCGSAAGVMRASSASDFSCGQLAARDRLLVDLRRVALAALGRLERDVLEHDLHAGAGADVGDAGAHHAGAEHADLGRLADLVALRAQRAGVDGLQVEEERLDHVLGVLTGREVGEVARLDARGGLEVDLGALDGRGHDGARRRVVGTLERLAQGGREDRQHLGERRGARACRRASCSPGGPTAAWPRPRRPGGLRQPRLGALEQLLGRDDLVDEALGLGVGGLAALALEQHLGQRGLQAEHAHGADHAAAAGEQAEGDLGQADLVASPPRRCGGGRPARSRGRHRARRR